MAAILVVDDRATNRQYLVSLLGYYGHRVLEAGDGATALAVTRAAHPDLVITDIFMPEMDGCEFIQQMRADPASAKTSVLLYSATYTPRETEAMAREIGADACLSKPAEPEEILAVVDRLLGRDSVHGKLPPELLHEDRQLLVGRLTRKIEQLEAEIARRRQVEAALRQSEERHRAFAELTSDYVYEFRVEPDGRFSLEWMSDAFPRISGYSIEEFQALPSPFAIVHADDLAQAQKVYQRIQNGESVDFETRLVMKHGEVRWIRTISRPIWDGTHNRVIGFYGAGQDITERKQAEETLRQSEERYRTLVEQATDGIAITSAEGRFLDVNSRYCAMTGYTRTELLSMHSRDLIIPEHQASRSLERAETIAHRAYLNEWSVRRKDGTVFPAEVNAELLPNGRLSGVVRDITERKQAEWTLRESERRLRQAVSAGNIGLWDWVLGTNIVYYSPEWKRQIGYTELEIGNELNEWQSRVHPEDLESTLATVRDYLAHPYPNYHVEFRFRHKDGSYRWIMAQGALVHDETGQPVRMIGSRVDITERRQVEESLRNSEETLRLALGAAQMGAWSWDIATHQTTYSEELARLFGLPGGAGATSRDVFLNCIHPDDRPAVDAAVARALDRDEPYSLEYRVIWSDGSIHWLLSRGQLHRDRAGQPLKVVGVVMDITARMEAELALRKSQAGLAAAQAQAKLGNWEYSFETQTARWSLEMYRLHGRDAALGPPTMKELVASVHPEDRQSFVVAYERVPAERCGSQLDYRVVRPDGSIGWMESRYEVIFDATGRPLGITGTLQDISERKAAAEALRASEERLRLALEGAHMGTFDWDVPRNHITWSRWHEELWGYAPGEFNETYEAFSERVHPDDLPGIHAEIARCMAAHEPFESEFRVVWPDGSLHWVHGRGEVTFGAAGEAVRMRGVVLETTERKKAEQVLLESHARLVGILNSMFPFVGLLSLDGIVLEANRPPLEAAGLTREDVIGKPCADAYWFSYAPAVQAELRDALARAARGEAVRYDVPIRVGDNRFITIDLMFGPLRDTEGNITQIVGSAVDITRRKEAERALQESEHRHRIFAEMTSDYIYVVRIDKEGRPSLEWMSDSFERITGYSLAEFQALANPIAIVHPDDRQATFEVIRRVMAGESIVDESRLISQDGAVRWVRAYRRPIWNDDRSRIVAFYGAAQDITDRKRAETLLKCQNQVLERIAADEPLSETMTALLQAIETQSPDLQCSILLLDAEGLHLSHCAAPRLPAEYCRAIDGMTIGPSVGSCGTAAFHRSPVIVQDIATDPLWGDYRSLALRHGLKACWSTPIFGPEQHVLGTFAMYYDQPMTPTARHLHLIEMVTHIAGIAIGKHRGDEALRQSQQRLALATESARIGIWDWDVVANKLVWDARMYTLYGIREQDFSGAYEAWEKGVLPEDRDRAVAEVNAVLEGAKDYHTEFRVRWPNGEVRHIEAHGVVRRAANGSAVRMIGANWDITERRHTEQALADSEQRLRKILDNLLVFVGLFSPDGKVLEANRLPLEMANLRREDVIGRPFADTFWWSYSSEVQERLRSALRQAAAGEVVRYDEVVRMVDRFLTIDVCFAPLRDAQGAIVQLVGSAVDITERKHAQEDILVSRERLATLSRQLLAAQETERRRLARELHDELGQVLTLVKMNVQAARRVAQDAARERLDAALEVAQQAIAQVRSLSLELRPSMLDDFGLKAALEWFVGHCAVEGAPAIELQAEVGEERFPTEVETAFFRVVQEAVTNAQRHAQAQRILIRAEHTEDALVASVRDDGVGFDAAAARDRAAHGGSTGLLGMEERVRLLGGDFRITTAPGRGVEVWAYFPVAKVNHS